MKTRANRFNIAIGIVMSICLIIPAVYFVKSKLYSSLAGTKEWYIIVGILFIFSCFLITRKAYLNQRLQNKVRLMILFVGISLGFGGLASLYEGIASEPIWWVGVLLLLANFALFQVAIIFAILVGLQYMKEKRGRNPF